MSAPHVTGAAALLWSYNPSLTRDQVRALLIAGAKDLGDPGTDPFYGAKLQTARFYFAKLLPETAMLMRTARAGSKVLMDTDLALA